MSSFTRRLSKKLMRKAKIKPVPVFGPTARVLGWRLPLTPSHASYLWDGTAFSKPASA